MAHYAEIINNKVNQVLVMSNDMSHEERLQWLYDNVSNNEWIQTSYNGKVRAKFAGVGDEYHRDIDAFLSPKPSDKWIRCKDRKCYVPKVPKPNDGKSYDWNEELGKWEKYERVRRDKE